MTTEIETLRFRASRHQQHLKYLKKYFLDLGVPLNDVDISNIMFTAGDNAVFEVPSDSEILSARSSVTKRLSAESLSSTDM